MIDAFYIVGNGENRGPFTLRQLQSMWNTGVVTAKTLYWQEGFDEWYPLSTMLDMLEAAHVPYGGTNASTSPASFSQKKRIRYGRRTARVLSVLVFSSSILSFLALLIPMLDCLTANPGNTIKALALLSAALLITILGIFISFGLWQTRVWAWWCFLAQSVLMLIAFPIGTIVGVVCLIFLFQMKPAFISKEKG